MIVRINAETVRQTHRNSSGVRVISLKDGDKLTAVAPVRDAGGDDAEAEGDAE